MKIQCNVCEAAEATVLCCADEAALCRNCDEKVHAANKLASKHQRVLLTSSNSKMPKCDICQETAGYFFCLEDRALLCRKCDVAIHTISSHVSSHQRFLLTGVKVGLEASSIVDASSFSSNFQPTKNGVPSSSTDQYTKPMPVQADGANDFAPPSLPFTGGSSANDIQQWEFNEFLGLTHVNHNYNYVDNVSSKARNGKVGDTDCSPILRAMEAELDEGLGQVPDALWTVPQINSSPTVSGLCWPKSHDHHHDQLDTAAFVPDTCYQQSTTSLKRRRQY
ncbi:B-box zinc finger protein 22-like [Rutidosis leptorrhynchoides]|uniref:B-box zinc finger protein 22-like n=1 Tax=Rutidosis leptorrhynchoides TaxID=125765 RepID=UPI003A993E68